MYINPFLAGVLTTIFAEISAMFVLSIVIIVKNARKH